MTLQQDMAHNKLMIRFQRHLDEAAFAQLVSAYTAPAAAVACQILNDRALAEDAVQEAFLRVIRRRDQFIGSHSFAGWFYAILRHVCIDILRKMTRDQTLLERLNREAEADTTDRGMSDHRSLLASLPAREKAVLELRVVHSLTFREIGAALSISEEAAKKRAQRGLCKLRETLSAEQPLLRSLD